MLGGEHNEQQGKNKTHLYSYIYQKQACMTIRATWDHIELNAGPGLEARYLVRD